MLNPITINRTAPCPCGSKKKYKNCCLKQEIALLPKKPRNTITQLSQIHINKTFQIEDTLGTGLATILANNLKISDIVLPENEKRKDSDTEVLPKLIEILGDNIKITPMSNGSIQFKTKSGIIVIEP
jgi:SEC-C motif